MHFLDAQLLSLSCTFNRLCNEDLPETFNYRNQSLKVISFRTQSSPEVLTPEKFGAVLARCVPEVAFPSGLFAGSAKGCANRSAWSAGKPVPSSSESARARGLVAVRRDTRRGSSSSSSSESRARFTCSCRSGFPRFGRRVGSGLAGVCPCCATLGDRAVGLPLPLCGGNCGSCHRWILG
jgi:hypothetical protein